MGEQVIYAGAYPAFKKCLVNAWPNGKVHPCAHMIMIDVKFPFHLIDQMWCVMRDSVEFIKHINMPLPMLKHDVATYIATYYPKTSAALFDGKSKAVALQIMMAEKAVKNPNLKMENSYVEAKKEHRKADSYRHVSLRSLSKQHDWKTVK
jgi:hypothetical protein